MRGGPSRMATIATGQIPSRLASPPFRMIDTSVAPSHLGVLRL